MFVVALETFQEAIRSEGWKRNFISSGHQEPMRSNSEAWVSSLTSLTVFVLLDCVSNGLGQLWQDAC